jgi:hypothetical protein
VNENDIFIELERRGYIIGEERDLYPEGPPAYLDSTFRPLVVRALRHYQKLLTDLSHIHEGEEKHLFPQTDPFGYYLVDKAREAGTFAQELKDTPRDVSEVIKEARYSAIVQQALAYYVAELKKNGKMIREGLGKEGDTTLFGQFNTQISKANILMDKDDQDTYF